MSKPIKPSIVFCHGIWADGSCFSKVIPALQAEGHEAMAVQYGLDTFTEDVAAIKRTSIGMAARPDPAGTLVALTGGIRVPGRAALLPVLVGLANRHAADRLAARVSARRA